MSDDEILNDLISISKRSAELGYVVAAEGNTSARSSSGDGFWIKRSGCSLGAVTGRDFIKMDVNGAVADLERAREAILYRADEGYRASIEGAMHALIYASQEGANFIIHTHQPQALVGCCTEDTREFFKLPYPDSVVLLGVPEDNWIFLDYASPGLGIAKLLKAALDEMLGDLRVVVLAKHGVITIGRSAAEAMARAEILEKASYVRLMSIMTGRPTVLSPEEAAWIVEDESEKYRQRVIRG